MSKISISRNKKIKVIYSALDKSFDVRSNGVWLSVPAVVSDDLAIGVDQELFEVPCHVASPQRGVLSQPQEERMGFLAEHFNLGKHWELNSKLVPSLLDDHGLGVWLLAPELVARERQDLEAPVVPVLSVHLN